MRERPENKWRTWKHEDDGRQCRLHCCEPVSISCRSRVCKCSCFSILYKCTYFSQKRRVCRAVVDLLFLTGLASASSVSILQSHLQQSKKQKEELWNLFCFLFIALSMFLSSIHLHKFKSHTEWLVSIQTDSTIITSYCCLFKMKQNPEIALLTLHLPMGN